MRCRRRARRTEQWARAHLGVLGDDDGENVAMLALMFRELACNRENQALGLTNERASSSAVKAFPRG
ncbi:MAG: hypothetical protein KatS3mg109_0413 [Pirellulaceae bacterium]|nr:MAG: hypothetical protein KatS3mg109_0413 [Pirellulaceae bacterium]